MKNKIVIIGNGAAGVSAAEAIVTQKSLAEVTIITQEPADYYYRPMLSEYIALTELPSRFYLHDGEWFKAQGIELLKGETATQIDAAAKRVTLADGKSITYDKLILATGSVNFIPPFPGVTLHNVYSLRTLADADQIKSAVASGKKAVVIGGGLLGLELGWQLLQLGVSVTVVEMMDRLLPRQLDEESSALFLKKVRATGMHILTSTGTEAILGEESVTGVKLSNGETLPTDYVFISIGIRADVTLASTADVKVNRGILVNSIMETSVKDILACGDCAEFNETNFAIWPEALAQGKAAGLSSIGIHQPYTEVVPFNMYHGMNLRLFSMGDVTISEDVTSKTYGDEDAFEKYFFNKGVLVGGILMGNIAKSSKLKKAIADGITFDAFDL